MRFEPLNKAHDRSGFSCGDPELDRWLRERAGQDERRNVARVFVALDDAIGVAGFYSLAAYSIAREDLPEEAARRLPRYERIPAALIGRLARDIRMRGEGIGPVLLADALRRALAASQQMALFAIVVEAKNAAAAEFYRGFGFRHLSRRNNRLFLPAATAREALAQM